MILETTKGILGVVLFATAFAAAIIEGRAIYIPLWVALIVAFAPIVQGYLANRQRRIELEAKLKREDEVAKKLEDKEALRREEAVVIARLAKETLNVTRVTHDLVNSQMTTAMQSELDALTNSVVMMKEVGARNVKEGIETSAEASAILARTEGKIGELRVKIDDRLKQDAIAKTNQKQQERDESVEGLFRR